MMGEGKYSGSMIVGKSGFRRQSSTARGGAEALDILMTMRGTALDPEIYDLFATQTREDNHFFVVQPGTQEQPA